MSDPLVGSKTGRTRMATHLAHVHGVRTEWAAIDIEDLVILWWLHGHEIEDTFTLCEVS